LKICIKKADSQGNFSYITYHYIF